MSYKRVSAKEDFCTGQAGAGHASAMNLISKRIPAYFDFLK